MKSKLFPILSVVAAFALLSGLVGFIHFAKNAAPSAVLEVTKDNFENEVLKSNIPVYVEFYVDRDCAPCAKQAPVVEKLAAEYAGKVKFVRINALKQPELAQGAQIENVPSHFFVKPAEAVGIFGEGYMDEATLRKFIESGLAAKPKPQQPSPAPTSTPDPGLTPDPLPVKP